MKDKNKKTVTHPGWMVEFYSGVAVHESGFSVFITDSYNHVASSFLERTTVPYLEKHGLTIEDLYFAGKQVLVQALSNKVHRLEIDISVILGVQKRFKDLSKEGESR